MKRTISIIFATLFLAAGANGAAPATEDTYQKIAAWLDANPEIKNDGGDGQYTSRLISAEHQPLTLDELTEYTRVRSIQLTKYGLVAYDYFNCMIFWEVNQLCFRKTGGSQRKSGLLNPVDDTHVEFDGWWFINGDEQVNDEEHHQTGILTKLTRYKVIMAIDKGDGSYEILEFAKPDGPTALAIEDKNGYLYSIVSDEDGQETLALEPGGLYDGDIVVPESVEVDGTEYAVSTIRRGAMWKKPGASNIGTITSVTLPQSVELVGGDAFRGNHSLKSVTYDPVARIENRAFFDCPALKTDPQLPVFAYTDPQKKTLDLYGLIVPKEKKDNVTEGFDWAFFKQNHSSITFYEWQNIDSEDAIACYSQDLDDVKGATYVFRHQNLVEDLFKGYLKDTGHYMMVADNDYVATHDFPAFSRWIWGEAQKDMPSDFASSMTEKYGREVASCLEAGKVTTTGEQLAITEFKIKDKQACFALSWVKDGAEVCSYVDTTMVVDGEENSVWNVDDDGSWGIPHILTIAYDEHGNVDLFLAHLSPESISFMHLRQNGSRFDVLQTEPLYILYH